jgi:hypothetical protein
MGDDEVDDAGAVAPHRPHRRGLWAGVIAGAAGSAVLAGSLAIGTAMTTGFLDARERLDAEGGVSTVERALIDETVAAASEVSAQIAARQQELLDAQTLWRETQQSVEVWRDDDADPAPAVPNPGGAFPGGDAEERALLESIGASDVQVILDAGPENCGYAQGPPVAGWLAIGGCYNPNYRQWLFVAWDPGFGEDEIWPIFVHEAMHWYQWDRYADLFEAAARSGVSDAQYRAQIESDASCRAVFQHGVDRAAFDNSSAPCDVDGWHDGWLVEQLAALGVPTAAPDPAAYEVQEVVRP